MSDLVVLFDDERSFLPGFRDEAVVIRGVREAENYFPTLIGTPISELWLDYVLRPGVTTDAFSALKGLTIEKIYLHSSANGVKELIEHYLKRHEITTPVVLHDRSVFAEG